MDIYNEEKSMTLEDMVENMSSKKNFLDKIFPNGIFDYNPTYAITHFWVIFKEIRNEIKWAWQRVFRGWDDRVVWSIDYHLTKFMPVWLRKLKTDKGGVPMMMFQEGDFDEDGCNIKPEILEIRDAEYLKILDEIILGFEAHQRINDEFMHPNSDEYKESMKLFERGMVLLTEYFSTLWD